MSGKQGMRRYPNEMKVEAIRLFFEERQTRKQIKERLCIGDEDTVKKWVQTYRRKGMEGLIGKPIGRPRKQKRSEDATERIKKLEMENELLRNFLYELGRR